MCEFSVEELIERYPEGARLPCAVAHMIAELAGQSPQDVGRMADEKKVELTYCQLGLFGYGRKRHSLYKIVGRPVEIDAKIVEEIRAGARDGRIDCISLWRIADAWKINRSEAGNAADSLGLKIKGCQLGAF